MTDPLIIAVAPNGARRGKRDHPAIPLSPDEIGVEAASCRDAGAAMIHLHVRNADGRHSLDPDLYRAAMAAVRREAGPDIIVQVTTEAVGLYSPDQQMATVRDLQLEAFSVAVRELFADTSSEKVAGDFLHEQSGREVLVQHILYDLRDLRYFADLIRRGLVPTQSASALFVLGRYTQDQQSEPSDLLAFLAGWDLNLPWALCAFGRREAACAVTAAMLGGHVRVGFENNLHLPDGSIAPNNAALVRCVSEVAEMVGQWIASPEEARAILSQHR